VVSGQRPVRAAAFLDRDGVLNELRLVDGQPRPPAGVGDLVVAPGAAAACARLHEAGLLLVVVTNQPDVARGRVDLATVDAINGELRRRLPLDDLLVCPHDDGDACACRKPLPGLLRQAADRWGIDLPRSVMVGDRWRDIEAGRRAGCATVHVDHGYHERRPAAPDLVVRSLAEAVPWILRTTGALPPSPSRRRAGVGGPNVPAPSVQCSEWPGSPHSNPPPAEGEGEG
jgi:D-glycero-D-manno-heptose 1,7-bisphosphate phosphatase